MKVFVVIASMLIAMSFAAPSISDNKVTSDNGGDGQFGNMYKIIENCVDSGDVTTCLAVKGITALNRAARSQNLEIIPGINFIRDPSAPALRAGKALSENEIETALPTDVQEKRGRLYDLAVDSASNFLTTHNLNIKLPKETTESVSRAIEEGRGKIKKFIGPVALAIGAKLIALFPIFLGGLILLVTKAIIVAKVALLLAVALGLQKLGGGGGGGGYSGFGSSGLNLLSKFTGASSGNQGWASGGGGGGASQGWSSGGGGNGGQGWSTGGSSGGSYPYARSYEVAAAVAAAQDKAYNAQIPSTNQ